MAEQKLSDSKDSDKNAENINKLPGTDIGRCYCKYRDYNNTDVYEELAF